MRLEWKVPVRDTEVSAVYEAATYVRDIAVFVCAHGAGGSMNDRMTLATSIALRDVGLGVVRFNFPYTERGSRRPDPMPLLVDTVAAVTHRVRDELTPEKLVIGGRSMGGRAASMLAAEREKVADGLLLLAYPLHPAGKPEKLRDAHIPRIDIPVLCVTGTRDALCTPELMDRAAASATVPFSRMVIDGADHSFHMLASSGIRDADVLRQISDEAREWVTRQLPLL
jgi:predicted alpha/beta-hydrolase family hydrolase